MVKRQKAGRTNLAGVTKPLGESVAIYRRHKALRLGKCPHIYQGLRPLSSTELGPFIPSDMLYLAVWVSLMAQVTTVRTANFHILQTTVRHGTA